MYVYFKLIICAVYITTSSVNIINNVGIVNVTYSKLVVKVLVFVKQIFNARKNEIKAFYIHRASIV